MADAKHPALQPETNYRENVHHISSYKAETASHTLKHGNVLVDIGDSHVDNSIYDNKEVDFIEPRLDVVDDKCDFEDRGIHEFDNLNSSASGHPRLVFKENCSNIVDGHENYVGTDEFDDFVRGDRSLSDISCVRQQNKETDGYSNPVVKNYNRNSHVSVQSSDSDLIISSDMPNERDQLVELNGVDRYSSSLQRCDDSASEQDDSEWHCHKRITKIPPDLMARKQLIAVSVLCFIFMIGEAVGGALSNSLALFTDVLHLGSDLFSFLISLFAIYLSKKQATQNMSFGYHRAEVLGALMSVFVIWVVTAVLVYVAIERIVHEHYKEVKADEMLITAVLGVIFNVVMGVVLHSEICCRGGGSRPSFGHGHSHGGGSSNHSHHHGNNHDTLQHSHQSSSGYQPLLAEDGVGMPDSLENEPGTLEEAEPIEPTKPHPKNINVRAAFIHVVGDIIQSLGVLLAAIIIKLKPEDKYRLADPICTFLFSVLVLFTTITVLRDTLRIIMEGVPKDTNYYAIKSSLAKIHGVRAVHGLTVWCLTLEKNALAVHLSVDKGVDHQAVLAEATEAVHNQFNFLHTTIQVEDHEPKTVAACSSCQELRK
ncbi:proton-coupled zinc antiporter SLC30A8-like [Mya arenaria]|uniref:proton-coupled zinc antiporter SLC30A8-like n=1 Tax=Mya arenaria TaxID=6604 RepID=UPI0022E6CE2B|nr:proton-coupled zinc antiporter SLC30A8-like [Mya arenaria]